MYARSLIFCSLLLLSPGGLLFAEEVQHHGVTADADGALTQCISCHDGSVGEHVSFCTVQCDFKTPHSVLKDYPPRDRELSFAPIPAAKAKGIKFINGKVTCVSCHNLRNPAKNHLVMDNRGSRLCLTCHIRM